MLKALVPYTNANLLLAFKPNLFFDELERISGYSRATLRTSYYRAKRTKLVSGDTVPRLTHQGMLRLQPFIAEYLPSGAKLMVIFDIPEIAKVKRARLRTLLKNLRFVQVQQSVWMTEYDHREVIRQAITELELDEQVQVYEAMRHI